MASVSTKGSETKKNTPPKITIPQSNGSSEKVAAKLTPVKSPPKAPVLTKVIPNSTAKMNNDIGKNNSIKNSKMDPSSPPKVTRSPSAKSITPPNKPHKTSSGSRKGSQGDNSIVNSVVKNGISVTDLTSTENEVLDANTGVSKSNGFMESLNGTENSKIQCEISNICEDIRRQSFSAACSVTNDIFATVNNTFNELCRGDSVDQCSTDTQIVTSKLNHAGDQVSSQINHVMCNLKKSEEATVSDLNSKNILNFEVSLNGVCPSNENCTDKLSEESNCIMNGELEAVKCVESKSNNVSVDDIALTNTVSSSDEISDEQILKTDPPVTDECADNHTSELSSPKDSYDSSSTDYRECSAETAKLIGEPEVTKQSYRLKIWEHLEKNDLVLYPLPCKGRIPNFKGAHTAAEKLTQLDIFKNSKTIMINADKPQELARFHTLEFGKRLVVPVPRLVDGLFHAIIPPAEASKYQLRQASQRYGLMRWGKSVNLEDKVQIDLMVLGSVAVDKKGHRIGKGEGFADLEFAMLVKMNTINENTVIVTTVHDDQVFDELPEHLFKEHDLPVDWIVTPTQVIEVAEKRDRPKGIIWNILSKRKLLQIPVLQKIREEEISKGEECELKEVDSEVEDKPATDESVFRRRRFTRRRGFNNYSRSTGDPIRDSKLPPPTPFYRRRNYSVPQSMPQNFQSNIRRYNPPQISSSSQQSYSQQPYQPRRNNYYQNRFDNRQPIRQHQQQQQQQQQPSRQSSKTRQEVRPVNRPRNINGMRRMSYPPNMQRSPKNRQYSNNVQQPIMNGHPMTKSVEVQVDKKSRPNRQFIKRKRAPIEFSLRLKNIGQGVRVRDLKNALNERGVKPRDITWKGFRGFAFLHFVKTVSKEDNKTVTVDDVLRILDGLPLPPKNKKSLIIEPAKPRNFEVDNNNISDNNTYNSVSVSA